MVVLTIPCSFPEETREDPYHPKCHESSPQDVSRADSKCLQYLWGLGTPNSDHGKPCKNDVYVVVRCAFFAPNVPLGGWGPPGRNHIRSNILHTHTDTWGTFRYECFRAGSVEGGLNHLSDRMLILRQELREARRPHCQGPDCVNWVIGIKSLSHGEGFRLAGKQADVQVGSRRTCKEHRGCLKQFQIRTCVFTHVFCEDIHMHIYMLVSLTLFS